MTDESNAVKWNGTEHKLQIRPWAAQHLEIETSWRESSCWINLEVWSSDVNVRMH
jgi:hypothetical protein